ncbi:uncharacterized protein LOC108596004 [Drosophila busckii]|uniref:uncharacterized protein LOC108596004 n=1 Tax=Drosophila busckii TaxID=30019 RepID=UPI00083E9E42|nr:uncharacterized protein LOC108596004 [Drosophila busckii]
MKCLGLCLLLLLSLLSVLQAAPQARLRIHVRNGDIKVHGNCNHCNIRTTKNTAEVSMRLKG